MQPGGMLLNCSWRQTQAEIHPTLTVCLRVLTTFLIILQYLERPNQLAHSQHQPGKDACTQHQAHFLLRRTLFMLNLAASKGRNTWQLRWKNSSAQLCSSMAIQWRTSDGLDLGGILLYPLTGRLVVLCPVLQVQLGDFGHQRIVWVRVCE